MLGGCCCCCCCCWTSSRSSINIRLPFNCSTSGRYVINKCHTCCLVIWLCHHNGHRRTYKLVNIGKCANCWTSCHCSHAISFKLRLFKCQNWRAHPTPVKRHCASTSVSRAGNIQPIWQILDQFSTGLLRKYRVFKLSYGFFRTYAGFSMQCGPVWWQHFGTHSTVIGTFVYPLSLRCNSIRLGTSSRRRPIAYHSKYVAFSTKHLNAVNCWTPICGHGPRSTFRLIFRNCSCDAASNTAIRSRHLTNLFRDKSNCWMDSQYSRNFDSLPAVRMFALCRTTVCGMRCAFFGRQSVNHWSDFVRKFRKYLSWIALERVTIGQAHTHTHTVNLIRVKWYTLHWITGWKANVPWHNYWLTRLNFFKAVDI